MKILEAMRKGSRYYRASQGAKYPNRKRMGRELIADGVFNVNEVSAIVGIHKKTIKKWPEMEYLTKRLSMKFNPSSLDLMIMVRRALLQATPLQNEWFSVLYNDGNSQRVIAFFTGIDKEFVRKRINGEITDEWFNHRKRLGGIKAWETRKQRGKTGSSYRPNGGRPSAAPDSDSPGVW